MTINVSIDAKGNLVCDNATGSSGNSVTWAPDANSISAITSITLNVGTFTTAPSARNSWTGTLGTDGNLGNNTMGWDYTIAVNGTNGAAKQKSPKIVVATPNIPVHH